LQACKTLSVKEKSYDYFSLKAVEDKIGDVSRLPFSLKVLLENLLRNEDGRSVHVPDIEAFKDWLDARQSTQEIAYHPACVLLQDFTDVPAVVGVDDDVDGNPVAYSEILVGRGAHATRANGFGVLGLDVGSVDAEMLGQPVSMIIPEVIGFKLTGRLKEGAMVSDLVLTVTQMLRAKGVAGQFVEFYGEGLDTVSLADRVTISNTVPEYGAICCFFPVDEETCRFLDLTGCDEDRVALVRDYTKKQGMWRDADMPDPVFTDILELNMADV